MRPETGPMKFGDDWRGVFIRGDNAFNYAMHLERLLKRQPTGDVIGMMVVRELHALLTSSDERVAATVTQHMRAYVEAIADHEVAAQIQQLNAIADRDPDDCAPCLDHGQSPDRGEGP